MNKYPNSTKHQQWDWFKHTGHKWKPDTFYKYYSTGVRVTDDGLVTW